MTSDAPPLTEIEDGLRRYDVSAKIEIVLAAKRQDRPPSLERRIDALWQAAMAKDQGLLFDGVILCVTNIVHDTITVTEDRYRAYYAQRREPALFNDHPIRPLASSGLVTCTDGIVFAKRGHGMFLDPGKWELAPSGTFDGDTIGAGKTIDASDFLLRELKEELGIDPAYAKPGPVIGLYEHLDWKGIDLAIALDVGLTGAQVEDTFAAHHNEEYSAIAVVAPGDVPAFAAANGDTFLPLSRTLLKRTGYL